MRGIGSTITPSTFHTQVLVPPPGQIDDPLFYCHARAMLLARPRPAHPNHHGTGHCLPCPPASAAACFLGHVALGKGPPDCPLGCPEIRIFLRVLSFCGYAPRVSTPLPSPSVAPHLNFHKDGVLQPRSSHFFWFFVSILGRPPT